MTRRNGRTRTPSSPLPRFSARTMYSNLTSSLQTAIASCRLANLGSRSGHLVPFFGSDRKLMSFSPSSPRKTNKSWLRLLVRREQATLTITTDVQNPSRTFQVVHSLLHQGRLSDGGAVLRPKEVAQLLQVLLVLVVRLHGDGRRGRRRRGLRPAAVVLGHDGPIRWTRDPLCSRQSRAS
jgi:hypothetical protein